MTLENIYNLAFADSILKNRVTGACIKAAWDILNEAGGTANHANRVLWANAVILNPETKSNAMFLYVLQNTTIQTNGTESVDNDIQFVVNSIVSNASILTALGY